MNGFAWQTMTLVVLEVFQKAAMSVTTRGRGGGGSARGGYVTTVVWTIAFFAALFAALLRLDWLGATVRLTVFVPGMVLIAGGIALRIWGLVYLRRYFSEIIIIRRDHELVTAGPYRLVRHPLHVGILMQMVGFAVLARLWWVYLLVVVASVAAVPRERLEERMLEEHFGEQYRAYRGRTFGLTDVFPGGFCRRR